MEKRYINESMYKKRTSRKRRDISIVKSKLNSKSNTRTSEKKAINQRIKITNKVKRKSKQSSAKNIVICILLLIAIAVISRAILKEENEPFIYFPFITEANEEIIKIGVITNDNLSNLNTKNSVLNELQKYSKDMLLEINEDYSITYKCISDITKISNKEYLIKTNSKNNITANSIKEQLDIYRKNKESIYYNKLENIKEIQVIDINTLKFILKTDNPYFIYNLDICLNTASDMTNYLQDASSNDSKLIFNRNKRASKELPAKIIVTKYKDMYAAVEAYKNQDINIFITNAENVENILGKYEYNIKTFRNGANIFLLGNPKSEIFVKQEVRKAIAYGIDRSAIITDILKSKGVNIDLPYIYDNVKYKYDVYAAENLLLTNGYKKSNKVYYKIENGKKINLELDLLVNKDDATKVAIANKIKNNLSSIGIEINIEKLTTSKIESRIKKGEYDLLLANINLNNIPDISFIKNNLFIIDNINEAIGDINTSTINELNKNIATLQNALSGEVSIIGICSDVSYLIYSKEFVNINNVSYMNLFKDLLK